MNFTKRERKGVPVCRCDRENVTTGRQVLRHPELTQPDGCFPAPYDVSSLRRAGCRNDFRRTPQTPTRHLAAADAAGCALLVRRILAYVKIKRCACGDLDNAPSSVLRRAAAPPRKHVPWEGGHFFSLRPLRPPRHAGKLRVGCAPSLLLQTGHCTRSRRKSKGKCTPGGALAFSPSSDAQRLPEGAGCAVGNNKKIWRKRNGYCKACSSL